MLEIYNHQENFLSAKKESPKENWKNFFLALGMIILFILLTAERI